MKEYKLKKKLKCLHVAHEKTSLEFFMVHLLSVYLMYNAMVSEHNSKVMSYDVCLKF